MADFNTMIKESEARQTNKLDSVVGGLQVPFECSIDCSIECSIECSVQDAVDATDRKYSGLPNAMSGHSQRIADLEDEIRRLLSELRRVEAKVRQSNA